jgi:hypothetical protein
MSTTLIRSTAIRPFQVEIPKGSLDDLRRRLLATRWPSQELVGDASQGVQLATTRELVRHWGTEYELGRLEARLNAVPQFKTEIDGLDLHFIHVRSEHENALPLIVTHGWPGSVIELLDVIGPLTDPDRARRPRRRRVRSRDSVAAGLRLLDAAGLAWLGPGSHGTGMGRADEAARLHALRRPGR